MAWKSAEEWGQESQEDRMTGDSCFPFFLREVRNGWPNNRRCPNQPWFLGSALYLFLSCFHTRFICSPKNVFSIRSHRVSDKESSEGILARRLQFVNFNSNTTWSLKTLEYNIWKFKKKKKDFFPGLLCYLCFKRKSMFGSYFFESDKTIIVNIRCHTCSADMIVPESPKLRINFSENRSKSNRAF